MKLTSEEIQKIAFDIFSKPDPYIDMEDKLVGENSSYEYINPKHVNVSVTDMSEDECVIDVCNMYDYIQLTFGKLDLLSKKLNCKEISEISREKTGGCDTCDYGSSYEITLKCWGFND